jgi:hypothetical protein
MAKKLLTKGGLNDKTGQTPSLPAMGKGKMMKEASPKGFGGGDMFPDVSKGKKKHGWG